MAYQQYLGIFLRGLNKKNFYEKAAIVIGK